MPTGYTAKLCDGEQSFEDFVWNAVRAMTPFIHMRDDAHDAQLRMPDPGFFESGTKEKIQRRQAELRAEERELRRLKARSKSEVESSFLALQIKTLEEYSKQCAQVRPVAERLAKMRSQVADWVPPSFEHEGFKRFMLQQLDETIRFEGSLPEKPVFKPSAQAEHDQEVTYLERRIERSKELLSEEQSRGDSRQECVDWIDALLKSVPPPPGRLAP